MHEMTKLLMSKLSKEELHKLVTLWDKGIFDIVIVIELLGEDVKNYPDEYVVDDLT